VHIGIEIVDVADGQHGNGWKLALAQFEAQCVGDLSLSDRHRRVCFIECCLDQLRFFFSMILVSLTS